MTDRDPKSEIEALFPGLPASGYVLTSPYDRKYNCVAYVAGDRTRWWEPESRGGWHWPSELPRDDYSMDNFFRCFELMGFESASDPDLEPGIEKIAIYIDDDGEFSHVAKQLADGWWSSKLGAYEDLSHQTIEALFAGRPIQYGENVVFMQRTRQGVAAGRSGLIIAR